MMDDEKEKAKSSILKQRKQRNALQEIAVQVEDADGTTARARRVSFASSNQIKQFTTDEEKNTIWDSTYEECIEGSENSPFSLNLPHTSSTKIIIKKNIEITVSTIHSVSSSDNLDFTLPVTSDALKVNPVSEDMSVGDVEMSFTQPVQQIIQQVPVERVEPNVPCDESMEFTTVLNNLQFEIQRKGLMGNEGLENQEINNTNVNRTSRNSSGVEMDFTIPVGNLQIVDMLQTRRDSADPKNKDSSINSRNVSSVDMELTRADLQFSNNNNVNRQENERTYNTILANDRNSVDMELTTALNTSLQSNNPINHKQMGNEALKNQEIHNTNFNHTSRNSSGVEMDFTVAVANLQIDDTLQTRRDSADPKDKDSNIRSSASSIDMELTIAGLKCNDNNTDRSSIDMELTTAFNTGLQGNSNNPIDHEQTIIICNEDLPTGSTIIVDANNSSVITTIKNLKLTAVENNDDKNVDDKDISCMSMELTTAITNLEIGAIQNIDDSISQDARNISCTDTELTTETKGVDVDTLQSSSSSQQQNKQISNEDLNNEDTSIAGRNLSNVDMEYTRATNTITNHHCKGSQQVNHNNDDNFSPNNKSKRCETLVEDLPCSKLDSFEEQMECDNDDIQNYADKSKVDEIVSMEMPTLGPLSNDPSLTSIIQFTLGSMTSNNDDTQQLINYRLSEKTETKSDLSRVAAGDLVPSFSRLCQMPLGEHCSNSFHVSMNDMLESDAPKISEAVRDDPIEHDGMVTVNKSINIQEGTVVNILESTGDTSRNSELYNTQPPEELLEITNSINITDDSLSTNHPDHVTRNSYLSSMSSLTNRHNTLISVSSDNNSTLSHQTVTMPNLSDEFAHLETENSNSNTGEFSLMNAIIQPKYGVLKPPESTEGEYSMKTLCDKLKDLMERKVQGYENSDNNKTTSDQSSQNYTAFLDSNEAEKSIDLKIRDLEESNKKYWQLLSVDDLTYKFATLFRTVLLTVTLEENSDKVCRIEIEKKLRSGTEPEALYAHKVFCDKLSPKCIKAALGDKYDIRSLLDFAKETMHKLLEFLREYDQLFLTYGMMMNEQFRLEFSVIKVSLTFVWKFSINMLELDCISDKTVEYYAKIGTINKREIQHCIEKCPSGTAFIKVFAENIYELVNRMQNKQ